MLSSQRVYHASDSPWTTTTDPRPEIHTMTGDVAGFKYYPQLDGIRAVAIAAVFIGHLIPLPFIQKIVGWGDMGVVLFFCLSGFLITGILLRIDSPSREGSLAAVKLFYIRRALRIFPIYYLTIGLALAMGYGPVVTHFFRLITYSLNVPGLPPTDRIGAVSHFWSLSVEEQYYLFWPMVVVFLPRRLLRRFVVGLILLSLVYKLLLALAGAPYKLVFANLLGCLDSLGFGSFLAISLSQPGQLAGAVRRFVLAGKWAGVVWAIMTGVRIAVDIDPYYEGYRWFGVIYFSAAAIAFTGLIAFATGETKGWLGRFLENGLMVRIGRISYGLYVYHFFFPYTLVWLVSQQYIRMTGPWDYAWVGIFGSVVVAALSYSFIERPILRLKKYFSYSRPGDGAGPPLY